MIGEYRPDPTDETGRFGLVDVKAVEDVPKPVTLAAVKADPKLKDMVLVREARLSGASPSRPSSGNTSASSAA